MKPLKIVFMGTPDFAVGILEEILNSPFEVTGVVTAPDKPAGRGQKLQEPAVKKFAREKGLKVLQPTNLKSPEFLEELKALEANLQVVVAFRMLPKEVWSMPALGTFNLHASLLPQYRGAAPINWAIINGERTTGVTTFFIDDKIDTGAIIMSKEVAISETETAGTLHDKLMKEGASLVTETLKSIAEDKVITTAQPDSGELRMAPKIHKETCEINWSLPADQVFDHIRGLSPYPTAWTTLHQGDKSTGLKIYAVSKELVPHQHMPGQLIADKRSLKVAASDGYIILEEVQPAGKRRMSVQDFLNGTTLNSGDYLG